MRNPVSKAALALVFVALGGGIGSARELTFGERVTAAMNQGLDLAAATSEASRSEPVGTSPFLVERARAFDWAVNAGENSAAATDTAGKNETAPTSTVAIERARRMDEELSRGQDYAQAWDTAEVTTSTR